MFIIQLYNIPLCPLHIVALDYSLFYTGYERGQAFNLLIFVYSGTVGKCFMMTMKIT